MNLAMPMEKPAIKPTPVLATLLIGVFIGLFNQTALNMAFTNVMSDFHIRTSDVQWLTTGYMLVLGILVPISGIIIQWFTTRTIFISSLLLSIVGALFAGLSSNFEMLLIARIVQAMGVGLLMPLMTNVILVLYPPQKRGTVMGLMVLVMMVAPAIGPTLSGLIIDSLGWHGIFWICLPLLAFSFIFGLIYMQNVSKLTKPKVDVLSIVLSSIGFGGIVYGFSSAGKGVGAWGQPNVILPLVVGMVSLIVFSLRQFKLAQPMLNLRVFQSPMFTLGVVINFLCMLLNLSLSILMPMYLKGGLLLTAFAAGLVLLPGGILNGLTSLITGRLFDRYGPKYLVIPGFLIAIITTFLFSGISSTTSVIMIVVLHSCTFIGIALIMMPAQTNGLNQLKREYYPDGSAVMGTLQQVAGAIGVAIAISNLASGQAHFMETATDPSNPAILAEALSAGVQNAFLFVFVIAVIGFVSSLFIKRIRV
ncbi:MDR family MFS transporter [Paenibacillus sp. Marseille-Q4541]|uniref:MDR family MFS transporter n=1 Tax=Paenibacillus sp. Marseille-Q4541 TaxID=2831522 RepID=UPI001BAAFE96|nr:MDR family MFS transporter [Paenibacillus sp. Marseille-Q4541]